LLAFLLFSPCFLLIPRGPTQSTSLCWSQIAPIDPKTDLVLAAASPRSARPFSESTCIDRERCSLRRHRPPLLFASRPAAAAAAAALFLPGGPPRLSHGHSCSDQRSSGHSPLEQRSPTIPNRSLRPRLPRPPLPRPSPPHRQTPLPTRKSTTTAPLPAS